MDPVRDKIDNNMKMISIILPTYNGGKYIKRAIESARAQSFSDWELLVIDDGSTDDTASTVNDFVSKDSRIIYLKNEKNLGIQRTLNRGLKEAKGDYIARIDDDDEWIDKDKLKKQFEFLEKNEDCVLVGTGVVVVDEEGKELFRYVLPETDTEIRKKILNKYCFVHSSVMFRKVNAFLVGGYSEREEEKHIEDYDLWLKLGTKGKFYNIKEYSVSFTLRGGSISSKNKVEQFKKDIKLTIKFRKKYPNFIIGYLRGILRIIIYGFILKTPIKKYLNKMIKIYKKI